MNVYEVVNPLKIQCNQIIDHKKKLFLNRDKLIQL